MNKEKDFSIFRIDRKNSHPYWGKLINLIDIRGVDSNKVRIVDEMNNKILRESGVEDLLKKALEKEERINSEDKKESYIYRKEIRDLKKDDEPVYTSLRFGFDESKKYWSEARISVVDKKLCVVRHKARGDIYNYYPIEEGKLEEAIRKAVKHPIKWKRGF